MLYPSSQLITEVDIASFPTDVDSLRPAAVQRARSARLSPTAGERAALMGTVSTYRIRIRFPPACGYI